MAVLNRGRDFIYLATPRTASRATVAALMKLDGSIEVAPHHVGLPAVLDEHPEGCEIVFTTVRNPYDWLVSQYLTCGGCYGTWDGWLEYQMQERDSIFQRFAGQHTEVAKYETLSTDLKKIVGDDVVLERDPLHSTEGKPKNYLDMWDEDTRTKVRQHFAADFEEYGYD